MAGPFDRIMTTVRPHLSGVFDEAIRQELYLVCSEFLKWSGAWQDEVDFTVTPGSNTGDITPFAGRVEQLLRVTHDGSVIRGARVGRSEFAGSTPVILPYSISGGELKALVSLNVTNTVTRDAFPIIPVEILDNYTDELVHGLLARMMSQPNKPYSNLPLAQFHQLRFRGGAARARNALKTGLTEEGYSWTYPQNFIRRK